MSIRLRIDHRKSFVSTHFSGDIGLQLFAKYAREFALLPVSEVPFIHFADATSVTRIGFQTDQMMPHAEQIIARLALGADVAAVIILAPSRTVLPFARMFRDIAADSFPLEVYEDTDQALDRLGMLMRLHPRQRRVPVRELT